MQQGKGQRDGGVCHILATDIDCPRDRIQRGDNRQIDALGRQLGGHFLSLLIGRLARKRVCMHDKAGQFAALQLLAQGGKAGFVGLHQHFI
jgi:hypothetical protein